MYTYSATQWIFGNESLEATCARLHKYGYDGIELAGEPKLIDTALARRLLDQYKLVCTSICGIYTMERDLSSANAAVRSKAVQYVKDCIDMANELGAAHVIVVPSPVGKTAASTTREEEWNSAVESLKEAGLYAKTRGIRLAIEALNRYETYLINDLDTAAAFVDEVGLETVGLMADLFHMNIEERDICKTLCSIAGRLIHVHIADNTREAAGLGQTNFESVMQTLSDISYKGPITMEFMPRVDNPYQTAELSGDSNLLDQYTEQSIQHIKKICEGI